MMLAFTWSWGSFAVGILVGFSWLFFIALAMAAKRGDRMARPHVPERPDGTA